MKRAVLMAVLAIAALWPPVHCALVEHYGMDSWKFGGWAMYATPRRTLLSMLLTRVPTGYKVIAPDSWPDYVKQAQRSFEVYRNALGDLWPPDDLAATALMARPDLDNVVVFVQVLELDGTTDRIKSTKQQFEYPRPR